MPILPNLLSAEDAVGAEEEENNEEAKGDGVFPFAGDFPDAKIFHETEEERAQNPAVHITNPADNGGNHSLKEQTHPHRRFEARIIAGEDARETGERGTDKKNDPHDQVSIDAYHF